MKPLYSNTRGISVGVRILTPTTTTNSPRSNVSNTGSRLREAVANNVDGCFQTGDLDVRICSIVHRIVRHKVMIGSTHLLSGAFGECSTI